MVTKERWNIAQDSEKEYWEGFTKESLLAEESQKHEIKSKILEKEWSDFITLTPKTKILQIGCGPEDVINYFSKGELYAVDPLANFCKNKFNLNYNNLTFLEARGEKLPFKDNFFDIVILANVLDHVEKPEKVLEEINRVLNEKGIFHFENLFYQKRFIFISKIWGFFKKTFARKIFNIHHPYMFPISDLKKLTSKYFFPIKESVGRDIGNFENLDDLKKQKVKSHKLTIKIPACFGLFGTINYMAICRKN